MSIKLWTEFRAAQARIAALEKALADRAVQTGAAVDADWHALGARIAVLETQVRALAARKK